MFHVNTLMSVPRRNTWLPSHALLMGHAFLRFLTRRPTHAFVGWTGSIFTSRLSSAWCRMLGSPVTNRQVMTPYLEILRLKQRDHSFRYCLCFHSVAIMVLRRNVLQEDDILCELYANTRSDVSDYDDSGSLDSDSDVPTTCSRNQLRSSTGPLTPQFPHPFFTYIYQDNFCNSVRLA